MMIIRPEELHNIPFLVGERFEAPPIPFAADILDAREHTHILIFTPSISWITLNGLREKFGTDPTRSQPCMYDQDWYIHEDFSDQSLDGMWHLIRRDVLEEARAQQPEEVEAALAHERFPSAVTCAFTFFVWWYLKNEILWKHDFVWCSDKDHNGDRVYVGRYEDPRGINKNGFNIHRHLSIHSAYSVAPEVVA